MCTSIILFRKSHIWPVIIGSNRDERIDRVSKLPGRHWIKQYPHIIAGRDEEKKGSWIGINDYGLVAIIHNRKFNVKNINNKKSRGKIVLKILNYHNIESALTYLSNFDRSNYNNFNLLIANSKKCYWVKHDTIEKNIIIKDLKEGISIITDKDLNDKKDKKINFYYNLFSSLEVPNPSKNNWKIWKANLTNDTSDQLKNDQKICFINHQINYATKSSSLIAIPNIKKNKEKIVFKSTISFPKINNYTNIEV